MPMIDFRGLVLPDTQKVNLANPTFTTSNASVNTGAQFSVNIVDSRVVVHSLKLDYDRARDIGQLYTSAFGLVRAVVDCYAFGRGIAYTVTLDEYVEPSGEIIKINPVFQDLASLVTAFDVSSDTPPGGNFGSMVNLVIYDVGIYLALNDLVSSMALPYQAPVNCARAMEGIRRVMCPAGATRAEEWSEMRKSLNVDRPYLSFIVERSVNPRHGDRSAIPAPELLEILRRSWTVMNRFFEFRKLGNQPLPLARFPLLK